MSAVDADAAAAVSTGGDNASTHDAGESIGDDSVDVYWGDEIISKTGHLKAVLPKLTAKASVAIATRSSGAGARATQTLILAAFRGQKRSKLCQRLLNCPFGRCWIALAPL